MGSLASVSVSLYSSAVRRDATAFEKFANHHRSGRTNPHVGVSFINVVDLMTRKHLVFLFHHFTGMILTKLTKPGRGVLFLCLYFLPLVR